MGPFVTEHSPGRPLTPDPDMRGPAPGAPPLGGSAIRTPEPDVPATAFGEGAWSPHPRVETRVHRAQDTLATAVTPLPPACPGREGDPTRWAKVRGSLPSGQHVGAASCVSPGGGVPWDCRSQRHREGSGAGKATETWHRHSVTSVWDSDLGHLSGAVFAVPPESWHCLVEPPVLHRIGFSLD